MSEIKISTEGFHCVHNARIYDLDESLVAAGYPMRTTFAAMDDENFKHEEKDLKRGNNLVKATLNGNQAHAQFMTGIRVAFDLTFSNKAWVEAERYRFLEFVSSQGTVHRITKFDLRNQCNEYVDPQIVDIMIKKVDIYNEIVAEKTSLEEKENTNNLVYKDLVELSKKMYLQILYSNPAGFELTARMTTNYRCLKNIYTQRHDHKLPEWREFCSWIETLPYAEELLTLNK